MTNVKMVANDTVHISSVSSDHLVAGQQFEVSGAIADDLEGRGLASRVVDNPAPAPIEGPEAPAPDVKEAEAPENKMEPAPENKAAKPAAKRRA